MRVLWWKWWKKFLMGGLGVALAAQVAWGDERHWVLDEYIAYAQVEGGRLKRLEIAKERAEARSGLASRWLDLNPELELGAGPRIGSEGTGWGLQLSIMQPVRVGGEREARIKLAEAELRLLAREEEVAQWALHAEIHEAFDQALIAEARMALYAEVRAFQGRIGELTQRRVELGEAAPLEASLSGIEHAEAQHAWVGAQREYVAACLELERLVNWKGEGRLKPRGALSTPEVPEFETLLGWFQERDAGRRYWAAYLEKTQAELEAAERGASIVPSFGLGLEHEGAAGLEPSVTLVMAQFAIPLPFVSPGQEAVVEKRHALAEVAYERALYETEWVHRLRALHAKLSHAVTQLALVDEGIVPQAEGYLALLERAYAVGEIGLETVILAQERFVRARMDRLNTHADLLAVRVALERMVGMDLPEVE